VSQTLALPEIQSLLQSCGTLATYRNAELVHIWGRPFYQCVRTNMHGTLHVYHHLRKEALGTVQTERVISK
jgi:hypothetical protein